jgi:predicted nucleotidyltransferase
MNKFYTMHGATQKVAYPRFKADINFDKLNEQMNQDEEIQKAVDDLKETISRMQDRLQREANAERLIKGVVSALQTGALAYGIAAIIKAYKNDIYR